MVSMIMLLFSLVVQDYAQSFLDSMKFYFFGSKEDSIIQEMKENGPEGFPVLGPSKEPLELPEDWAKLREAVEAKASTSEVIMVDDSLSLWIIIIIIMSLLLLLLFLIHFNVGGLKDKLMFLNKKYN